MISHPIPPVWNENSKILILGSFPSVRSREEGFFYGHPRNRFWLILSQLLDEPVPESIGDKKKLLLLHEIALWDVIASCDVTGSADRSIENGSSKRHFRHNKQGKNKKNFFERQNRGCALFTVHIQNCQN